MYKLVLIFCLFLLTSCSGHFIDITKTAKGFYDPTTASELEILKTQPKRDYKELGTLTITGYQPSDTAQMHNAIRAKAAQLGANAVILSDEGFVLDGSKYKRWVAGVAIRYE